MAVKVRRRYLHEQASCSVHVQADGAPPRCAHRPGTNEGTTLKKKILVAGAAAVLGTLVLSSGAVAAQHYLITSSSQIKDGTVALRDLTPFARKALKGQKGEKVDAGARGLQGPAGPQ